MNHKESNASSSTVSSTTSSFLDRLKGGGDTSSRTSLEEEYAPPKHRRGQDLRSFDTDGREDSELATGIGYTLWGRLASAAGNLGVDVSKAWATNIAVHSGEETPPGGESRLTQVMKAYHIEKARDPSDLPEWLFEEHERRPVGRSQFAAREDGGYEGSLTPKSRGLRDIYAAAPPGASSRTSGSSGRPTPNRFGDEPAASSKATNRLKAIRDAKRQNGRFDDDPPVKSTYNSERRDTADDRHRDGGADRRRVGLPSRPGGVTRRV